MGNENKNTLGKYTDRQIKNWSQNPSIIIYESDAQVRDFVQRAKEDKTFRGQMYFGEITKDISEKIFREVGINVESYNVVLTADEIRKVYKDHGAEATEAPRGQRAITDEDFVRIPQVIQNPDKIELAPTLYDGKAVIRFIKDIDGKTTVVSYVSDKHRNLRVQTMYAGRNKIGALAMLTAERATAKTPEADNGTGSINNINKRGEKSNTQDKKISVSPKRAPARSNSRP